IHARGNAAVRGIPGWDGGRDRECVAAGHLRMDRQRRDPPGFPDARRRTHDALRSLQARDRRSVRMDLVDLRPLRHAEGDVQDARIRGHRRGPRLPARMRPRAESFLRGGSMAAPVDLGIRGKVALVAAASQGMGRATALALAREGCKVAICARNEGPLQATVKAIRKETGAEVLGITADVGRAEDVTAFVNGAVQAFAGVDLLVANAGGPPTGRFEALTEDQDRKSTRLNSSHLVISYAVF